MQYLTDENIAEIGTPPCWLPRRLALSDRVLLCAGSAMTHIERMRLQAAIQVLSGKPASPISHGPAELQLILACALPDGAKGTE